MSARSRPAGCCTPKPVAPLPPRERDALLGVFKALSDPTRLELFRLVAAQSEPVCVCDLVDRFELSQPTISHHLRVLREAELLEMSKAGVWAFYSAAEGASERLATAVTAASAAPRAAASRTAATRHESS